MRGNRGIKPKIELIRYDFDHERKRVWKLSDMKSKVKRSKCAELDIERWHVGEVIGTKLSVTLDAHIHCERFLT